MIEQIHQSLLSPPSLLLFCSQCTMINIRYDSVGSKSIRSSNEEQTYIHKLKPKKNGSVLVESHFSIFGFLYLSSFFSKIQSKKSFKDRKKRFRLVEKRFSIFGGIIASVRFSVSGKPVSKHFTKLSSFVDFQKSVFILDVLNTRAYVFIKHQTGTNFLK